MKLHQLSLFVENRTGQVQMPCQVLADAGINIITLSLADTEQFGILRMIVSDWRKAKEALEAAGHVVNVTEVLALDVENRPGGLAEVLKTMEEADLNVEYMYAFPLGEDRRAMLVFRFEDIDSAIRTLPQKGVTVVSDLLPQENVEA
ncbi:MAG: ACT domain-containing protein [bacterium]